jgi:hypothetical protein
MSTNPYNSRPAGYLRVYDNCLKEARKYNSLKELRNKDRGLRSAIYRYGFADRIVKEAPLSMGNIVDRVESLKRAHKAAQAMGGQCLDTEFVNCRTKMLFQCSQKHEFFSPIGRVLRGGWCPECAGVKKKTIKDCQKIAEERGGVCLSNKYVNKLAPLEWKCSQKHNVWKASYTSVSKSGTWCPECSGSRGETYCRLMLETIFNKPFPTKHSKWLEGLELDGYNEELGIAFEYQGEQHYAPTPYRRVRVSRESLFKGRSGSFEGQEMSWECHRCHHYTANGQEHDCVMDQLETMRNALSKIKDFGHGESCRSQFGYVPGLDKSKPICDCWVGIACKAWG